MYSNREADATTVTSGRVGVASRDSDPQRVMEMVRTWHSQGQERWRPRARRGQEELVCVVAHCPKASDSTDICNVKLLG